MGVEREARWLADRIEKGDPYWPAQLAVATAIGLNFVLTRRITVGPRYLLPTVDALLLLVLVIYAPSRATTPSRGRRRLALVLISLVSLTSIVSLGLLVHYLLRGGKAGGEPLILS